MDNRGQEGNIMADISEYVTGLMTLEEISQYLKVSEKTVLRMIQKNEIPCVKIASQWRFDSRLIERWIRDKMRNPLEDDLTSLIEEEAEQVPLSRLTEKKYIVAPLQAGDKARILEQLIEPLKADNLVVNPESYLQLLLERETMLSTAVEGGIAFPHARNPKETGALKPKIVIGTAPEGIAFNAPDGQATRLFFLLFSGNEVVHLRLLAKLNRFLKKEGVLTLLKNARTPDDIMTCLMREESNGFK